jgi:hypothetical protein
MAEEDEDESPHMDMDETDEEAQDRGLAFDDDFTIEEDDRIFMAMMHPVDSHHFVRASSTVIIQTPHKPRNAPRTSIM